MWYDVLTAGILIASTLRGAIKGIVWQLASIAAIVLCFVFATQLSVIVAPHIPLAAPANRWISMILIYVLFSFISFGVARLLKGLIEQAKFTEFDRHLGSLFGLVKGIAFALLITFFTVTLSEPAREYILNSHSGKAAAVIMDRLHPVMPEELHSVLEPYIHKLDQADLDLQHNHAGHESDTSAAEAHDDHHEEHSSTGDTTTNPPSSLESIVTGLTGLFDGDLNAVILRALENTDPEDRPELLSKLRSGIPGLMRMIATEWQNGKPSAEDQADDGEERADLLKEIGAVYSEFPEAQEAIVDEIEWALSGVPEEVVLPLLRDWHADLVGSDAPDPDPTTNALTPLDGRIIKQLEAADIPLTSLSSTLQQRLAQSRR